MKRPAAMLLCALGGALFCGAQFFPWSRPPERMEPVRGGWIRIEGGRMVNEDDLRTARETESHSTGTPLWTNVPGFERDVFTFARVIFSVDPNRGTGRGRGRRLGWWVDYPDADLNFSWRLQMHTSIRTDPDARVLRLTNPDINRYPLLYMEHAGYMRLDNAEVAALRKYLRGGGALFVNDFWSAEEWDGFASEIKRVLPELQWRDLDTDHPLFSAIYPLRVPMQELQVPTIQFWNENHDPRDPQSTLQRVFRGEGSEEMHVRALHDERGRMLAIAIHNSDVSDGWEREGENEDYFNRYSERIAYPLGINIVFYLMTH
jgi:hypothetical protein